MKLSIKPKVIILFAVCVLLSIVLGILVTKVVNGTKSNKFDDIENVTWQIPFEEEYQSIETFTNTEGQRRFLAKREIAEEEYEYDILDENYKRINTLDGKFDLSCIQNLPYIMTYDFKGIFKDSGVGLITEDGKTIFEPKYSDFTEMIDGYFAATKINKKTEVKTVSIYDSNLNKIATLDEDTYLLKKRDVFSNIGNGLFSISIYRAVKDKGIVIFDAKAGKITKKYKKLTSMRPILDDYYIADSMETGTAKMYDPSIGETYGIEAFLFDKDLNFIKVLNTDYSAPHEFSEGLAFAQSNTNSTEIAAYDENFNVVFTAIANVGFDKFSEGKAILYNEDNITCVDKTGKVLFKKPRKYKKGFFFFSESIYRNGKVIVTSGDKSGIMDDKGNWIVDPEFYSIQYVDDDTYILSAGSTSAAIIKFN